VGGYWLRRHSTTFLIMRDQSSKVSRTLSSIETFRALQSEVDATRNPVLAIPTSADSACATNSPKAETPSNTWPKFKVLAYPMLM
jgi:hypothetical protein